MEQRDVLVPMDTWESAFPGAVAGVLVMSGVDNPGESAGLESRKRELEERVRERAGSLGPDGVAADPTVLAYVDYYRRHGKTYHVKAQWESVAVNGKPIPSRAALVEAMFMAELENMILTAGHDLPAVALPVRVQVTREGDRYVLMSGSERVLEAGDMTMVDGRGIVSSVLHGPDLRTRITADTREVLFAVYAPAGVGEAAVLDHLQDIRENVLLVAPQAVTRLVASVVAPAR